MGTPVQYHLGQFPPKSIDWENLVPYIGQANAAVARYDGILSAIPNSDLLLSPLMTQEAVLSSRIEGTQATMGEVLEFEAIGDSKLFSEERRNDIQEILNYRKAMKRAITLLEDLPICQRLIKDVHRVLMDSVRGKNRDPGEYRRTQNWIGTAGCKLEEARFVPISAEKLPENCSHWEKYVNSDQPDKLVQLAVLHVEFEALHPFLDGNGRLGRMLIPLFMYTANLIQSPMFYISAYFEANRDEYYDNLLAVSSNDNWNDWCRFFLISVKKQADENRMKVSEILNLYDSLKTEIPEATHSQYAIKALDWLFKQPIFKSSDFINFAGIPAPTARRIINVFVKSKLISTFREARGNKPAIYLFPELLNIAEGNDIFYTKLS